ncbi:methyltransferase family protein [Fibrobacterota bacterium]
MVKSIVYRAPRIIMILMGAAITAHFIAPGPVLIAQPYSYSGYVLIALGTAVMLWAWGLFKRAKTPLPSNEKPTTFVAAGPYRFTRNPMYLGMAAIVTGSAVAMATIPGFTAALAFFMIINYWIVPLVEENMVER